MIWSDADGMEDNSRRLSEEGEDSAKKARDTACDKVNEWTAPIRSHDITRDSKLCSQPLIFIVLSENFSLKVERDEFINLCIDRYLICL
jgi:hypothetical protein